MNAYSFVTYSSKNSNNAHEKYLVRHFMQFNPIQFFLSVKTCSFAVIEEDIKILPNPKKNILYKTEK